MVAYVSAIKIKLTVGLIADFTGKRDDRRNLPVETGAGSNFAVGDNCVIKARDAVRISKLIVHPEGCVPHSCSCIKRYITGHLVLQTRRWQDGIKQPLWPYFPANTCGRNHRVLPLHIDAHAKDKL
ncbi:MAG: hypothetical protein DMF08_12360 [Verrucomicrobia bacterium]|nr:MAG: hypothetical protein DMF08_12360 [Verrucomicrobiota bacterium]